MKSIIYLEGKSKSTKPFLSRVLFLYVVHSEEPSDYYFSTTLFKKQIKHFILHNINKMKVWPCDGFWEKQFFKDILITYYLPTLTQSFFSLLPFVYRKKL